MLRTLDMEQRSEEWFAARCGMVTASTVAQLVTGKTLAVANNPESRGATAALVAERVTGYAEPSFANFDMQRGIDHEPIARAAYAAHKGVEVSEVGFMVRDDWGFEIGCSPDGLIGDDGMLEIKCPRPKGHLSTIVAGEVPAYYVPQVQTALLVSGRKWIDYVSFCAGMPLYVKRVLPDQRWHDAIVAAVAAFETAAERLASDYLTAVAGLPATERINNDLGLEF